jgi:hypothetical protein
MTQELPPDPDSKKLWDSLPQTQPSRQAHRPAMGGLAVTRTLLVVFVILMAALVILSLLAGRM